MKMFKKLSCDFVDILSRFIWDQLQLQKVHCKLQICATETDPTFNQNAFSNYTSSRLSLRKCVFSVK